LLIEAAAAGTQHFSPFSPKEGDFFTYWLVRPSVSKRPNILWHHIAAQVPFEKRPKMIGSLF
jgi:hypothetical protein